MTDALSELFSRYADELNWGKKGWGGCTCECHSHDGIVLHVAPCCMLSIVDFIEMATKLKDIPEAVSLLRQVVADYYRGNQEIIAQLEEAL